jgi:hypothetical protein
MRHNHLGESATGSNRYGIGRQQLPQEFSLLTDAK